MGNQLADEADELIRALQDPALFDHPVTDFSVIETHISWILLTGRYAYKIKKPVDLGFVDFSTLARRKHFCEEELRLNRRYAEELYLEVVPIRGSHDKPRLEGKGKAIEYAIRMREFPQDALLSAIAAAHALQPTQIDSLADIVADFHERANRANADSVFGSCDTFMKWCSENFAHIEDAVPARLLPDAYKALKNWALHPQSGLRNTLDRRRRAGFVRECHGDLHLGNIALIDDRVTLFDCIEFNEELRWIDTMNESAFLAMDLQVRGYPGYAWRFLNRYLQAGGDYENLALLRHYLVYRALVRAKVEALRVQQHSRTQNIDADLFRDAFAYLELAMAWSNYDRPALVIMHGPSGSGKSTLARHLVETLGAVQVRSDVERKRLFEVKPDAASGSATEQGIYTPAATEQTYNRLADLARTITNAGYTVIVDASFLKSMHRATMRKLADEHRIPFIIVSCDAPVEVLRERIRHRAEQENDASEATLAVLEHQLTSRQALTPEERRSSFTPADARPMLSPQQVGVLEGLIATGGRTGTARKGA